jgi:cyclase
MLRTRIIPCLQLINESLVKTIKFRDHKYIGDPINTVRIFNELEVDELCFLDIRATKENRDPNFKILTEISNECFMPLSYGGGVKNAKTAKKILSIGFEKIIINTAAIDTPNLITEIANFSGNQSVVGSIDVKKNLFGKYQIYSNDGLVKRPLEVIKWVKELENLGVGELIITSIDRDGTWKGFDIDLLKQITSAVNIPVIANGGAGSVDHIGEVVEKSNVSAVALGSLVVYQAKDMGVLVNFPDRDKLRNILKQ